MKGEGIRGMEFGEGEFGSLVLGGIDVPDYCVQDSRTKHNQTVGSEYRWDRGIRR